MPVLSSYAKGNSWLGWHCLKGIYSAFNTLLLTTVCLLGTAWCFAADEQESSIIFSVPPGNAVRVLNDFALQAEIQLIYSYDDLKAKELPGLSGSFTISEGLKRLLNGSCLTVDLEKTNNKEEIPTVITKHCPSKKKTFWSVIATTLATLVSAPNSHAQADGTPSIKTIEEVTVTARRREEQAQSVPIAISAFSGDNIQKAGLTDVEDLRFLTPSLQISPSPFGSSVPGYTLRGQRQLEALATQDPSVVSYFADIPLMRPHGTNASLFDLANVQVLKGPQGTLFGRNTTGGAILINPKRPDFDGVSGYIGGGIGNYNQIMGEAALNSALTDTFAIRLAGRTLKHDGYTDNLFDGSKLDQKDDQVFRLGALWTPHEDVEVFTVYEQFKTDTNGQSWRNHAVNLPLVAILEGVFGQTPDSVTGAFTQDAMMLANRDYHTVINDADLREEVDTWQFSNVITWNVGELAFKNILGYREIETNIGLDYDGSSAQLVLSGPGTIAFFNSSNAIDGDQFSEEFQILGTAFDDKLDWITGVFYFEEEVFDDQRSELFGLRANTGTGINKSTSLFAQGSYQLSETLSMTFGYRHTWDDRELLSENRIQSGSATSLNCRLLDGAGTPLDPCLRKTDYNHNAGTWLISTDYQLTDDTLVYLAHRHGYRSGGLQLRANRPDERLTFDPEFVNDLEVGIKSTFDLAGVPTRINAAYFYQDYKDIQRTLSFGSPLSTVVLNAGKATIQGAEVELTIHPTDNLQLSAFIGYTDAQYDEFDNPGVAGQPASLADNEFALVPDTTAGMTITYHLPLDMSVGDISLRANWYYQSDMALTDINEAPGIVDSYEVYNLSADWSEVMGSTFDAKLYVKNATDKEYAVGGVSVYDSVGTTSHNLGAPRTFGFEVRYKFN